LKAETTLGLFGCLELANRRDPLAGQLDALKLRDPSDWQEEEIEKAGPMGIWDAVAEQAEKLVERLEKK